MPTKLTKAAIDRARPKGSRKVLWDTEVPGFGIVVHTTGRKTFILKYRTLDGTQRKPTIGTYGVVTLYQAREIARDIVTTVCKGGDPSGDRQDARKGVTVDEACERFVKEHASRKKPNTRSQYKTIIDKYVRAALGKRKIASVSSADVARLVHSVGNEHPVMANRVSAMLSKLFGLAELWQMRPANSNPCRHLDRYHEKKRHRDLSELELARLANALSEAESNGEDHNAVNAIRLLLFTGCRRSEVTNLRWTEVDRERGMLHLGDSKTGQKIVHLNSGAREIIESQEPSLGNPFVFSSRKKPGEHLSAWYLRVTWERVRKAAGLGARDNLPSMRIHDFRHNFASYGAASGLTLHAIGTLLGHKQPATTARYADLADSPAKQATELVGEKMKKAIEPKKSTK